MPEVLLPPDIIPQSEEIELVDDGSRLFAPAQGQNVSQVQQDYEPRLRVTQRFKALRQEDRARMKAALRQVSGQYGTIRAQVGRVLRGSMSASETLPNNTFGSGTTGWTATNGVLTVSDRISRLTVSTPTANVLFQSASISMTQYAPYVLSAFIVDGRDSSGLSIGPFIGAGNNSTSGYSSSLRGLRTISAVNDGTSNTHFPVVFSSSSGFYSGAFVECPYVSLSRCALADIGSNLLTYSDEFDNAAWTVTGGSISANAVVAPDGTATGDRLVENGAGGGHNVSHSAVTVSSSAADYSFSVAVIRDGRNFCWLQLTEATGGTSVVAYFDLVNGTVGTTITGANWSNLRAAVTNAGSNWYVATITARKTNAATSITSHIGAASADGTSSYTGASANAIDFWRATLAQSGVPTRLVQSTSAAVAGSAQTGNGIHLKGLPASTSALLKCDDVAAVNGELLQLTASLDSNAAGLGYLQFKPSLFRAVADNDPVIICAPMPKLKIIGNAKWTNEFGLYSDLEIVMEQRYE